MFNCRRHVNVVELTE